MIYAFSGKAGTGKSTTALHLQQAIGKNIPIVSFGDSLKQEVSDLYGIPIEACYSQIGKNRPFLAVFDERIQVLILREILQKHGELRRKSDPYYWVKKTLKTMEELPEPFHCIIDDVRNMQEIAGIRFCPTNSLIIRLDPFEGWEPGPCSEDITETALDNYSGFDLRLTPGFEQYQETINQINKLSASTTISVAA